MTDLEQRIHTFADERWPDRTIAQKLKKMGEEFGELAEAVAVAGVGFVYSTSERACILEEAADCANVLSDLCSMLGASLSEEQAKKLDRILVREAQGRVTKP